MKTRFDNSFRSRVVSRGTGESGRRVGLICGGRVSKVVDVRRGPDAVYCPLRCWSDPPPFLWTRGPDKDVDRRVVV